MNLESVISGCMAHDRQYQKQLYDYCYGYGMKVVSVYVNDQEEGREILQDAFIKLFASLPQYDPKRPLFPWFRVIILRTIINHYQKNMKETTTTTLTKEVRELYIIENDAISSMQAEELLALTQQLPPAYKLVLNLYAIEGYTHAEIAKMLNIREGTSKSNLSKARQFLTNLVAKSKLLVFF